MTRERTRAGLAAARRRGAHIGRPRAKVDLEQALGLRGEGYSFKVIASRMGVGVGTIHRLLREASVPKPSPASAAGAA